MFYLMLILHKKCVTEDTSKKAKISAKNASTLAVSQVLESAV